MEPDDVLKTHMSTYVRLLRNINDILAYDTILYIINSYINVGNLVAQHEPIILAHENIVRIIRSYMIYDICQYVKQYCAL